MKTAELTLPGAAFALLLATSNIHAQVTAEAAEAAYQAQQWQTSAEAFQTLTEAEPTNGSHWFRLGQSLLSLEKPEAAVEAFQNARANPDPNIPLPAIWLNLARAQAAAGESEDAINSLAEIEVTGARPYQRIMGAPEFAGLKENAQFIATVAKLHPCGSDLHRAFDFWVGEWEVSNPARAGWTARSHISMGNGGCSIHEDYLTQGGFAGRSINFYDTAKQKWHQTWMDNQGQSIYLEGGPENGVMILSNETNRVTWSVQADGQVRQHWQTTADGGETWTTGFDGYYRRVELTEAQGKRPE